MRNILYDVILYVKPKTLKYIEPWNRKLINGWYKLSIISKSRETIYCIH